MRIPVVFDDTGAGPADAWLLEAGRTAPAWAYAMTFVLPNSPIGHAAGCACCTPRGPVADALAAMFRARATGTAPFFGRVIVLASAAGEAAARAAVEADVIASARYRVEPV